MSRNRHIQQKNERGGYTPEFRDEYLKFVAIFFRTRCKRIQKKQLSRARKFTGWDFLIYENN